MNLRKPLLALTNRLKGLLSWISFEKDADETFFHPETVIFEQLARTKREWASRKNILPFMAITSFLLFAAILYVATIKGVAGNPNPSEMKRMDKSSLPFELSPERGRYAHTYALAETGSFSLSKELADVVYPDVGYVDGRFYSFFAPGISILAVPFYILGSYIDLAQVFTYGVISLFALGNLYVLYKIGKDIFKLPTANALLAPLIFGFASTSWSYATTLYQHHLTTFFIISSFYAVWRFSKKTSASFFWGAYIWFCYAAAFTVDYPNLLFMLPVIIYFFFTSVTFTKIKQKLAIDVKLTFIITSLFFVILSVFHGYYNYTQLGDWKKLSGNIVGYKTIREHQLLEKTDSKAAIKEIADDKTASSFFSEENLVRGLNTLLITPDKGIFFFSPIFILSIGAILSLLKKMNKERTVLLSLIGLNTFLYASFGDPWGGWAFGPRYLILSMSVLSLFIAVWIAQVKYFTLTRIVAFLLFAFSAAVSLLGVLTTNAVPPRIEADFLKMKYGFFLNFDFFKQGVSSSFMYNEYFSRILTLQQYFLCIYLALLMVTLLIFFSMKRRAVNEN